MIPLTNSVIVITLKTVILSGSRPFAFANDLLKSKDLVFGRSATVLARNSHQSL